MYPKYFEQYARVIRWYGRLKELYKGIPMSYENYVPDPVLENELLRDVAYAFFQNCHHFHEWLGGDNTTQVSRGDTRTFIGNNDCLMICDDLCNGTKHIELTKPRTGDSRIRIDKVATIYSPDREAGVTVRKSRCTISSKRNNINEERDALDLATECVKKWDQYMAQHNITIPREQEGDPSKDLLPLIVETMIKKDSLDIDNK